MKTTKCKFIIKKVTLVLFTILCLSNLKAQDKILFINGEELSVRVFEKSAEEIKYKPSDNPDGPLIVELRSNIFSIKYADGSTDFFGIKKSPDPQPSMQIPPERITDTSEFLGAQSKEFDGPRIGVTYITTGTTSDKLISAGKNPLLLQIGWQFETRIFTIQDGTSGLVEFVPIIGGLEQGLFLPSANFLIGLRGGGKRSVEFAMGPNISLTGFGMVLAAGVNFHNGKINFPVNLVVVPSVSSKKNVYDPTTKTSSEQRVGTGWRISLIFGFNSRKK
jgi:hypothetical protein